MLTVNVNDSVKSLFELSNLDEADCMNSSLQNSTKVLLVSVCESETAIACDL